ncbi:MULTISPECIES: alpha/beta hydrolase [unclassified Mycobacterium]|uniref:alpha/beta hydrolase n=1 Tax=unclassified Mycobacterium TaxID=2642494 RepID=UPI000800A6E6|nr:MULTISPECIES: alpha/beta fold hydrolase [unclassified Mycobacterium]OBG77981.1 alpha/beta hydrolase [Mycobacterium sp. E1214]OBH26117.1 alpha/beta hydrolase [Mycobacterium sp. E1319]
MKLEVIDKGSSSAAHPAPLLFIHGSWHAAWCWDEHFLDFFADASYRAVAVSLRNHGQSERARARRCSVADWVQDVVSVARCLPVEPVVIGHSMGGFIVQKYLETYSAPAGVLLATMPVSGASRALIRILGRHPTRSARALIRGKTLSAVNTPGAARENFYSAGTPDPDLARYAALLDEEYVGRQALDLTLLSLPKPKRVTTPLLVLGAAEDACFSPKEIRKTARAYGTDADFFIGMGHNMMLEPDWRAVAERIDGWLSTQGL